MWRRQQARTLLLSLKPLVRFGHLGAVGPVERVLVAGVLRAPPVDRDTCKTNDTLFIRQATNKESFVCQHVFPETAV